MITESINSKTVNRNIPTSKAPLDCQAWSTSLFRGAHFWLPWEIVLSLVDATAKECIRAKAHNIFLTVYDARWRIGSNNAETAETVRAPINGSWHQFSAFIHTDALLSDANCTELDRQEDGQTAYTIRQIDKQMKKYANYIWTLAHKHFDRQRQTEIDR